MITSKTKLCVGIGDPIVHSLGPVLHNPAYKVLGIEDRFVYTSLHVKADQIKEFILGAKATNIRGVTCTLPHKETVMPFLDKLDETAEQIGAVNTIVNEDGVFTGYNTDWIGAVEPLKNIVDLKDKKVAVIGAGGAAKAFVYGLTREGAKVTVFNRTVGKGESLAGKFNCASASLEDQAEIVNFDIICNASSVGFAGSETEGTSPIDKKYLKSNHIVFDAIYSPLKTQLIKEAEKVGAKTITGTEMLLYQGFAQFKLYTGFDAPKDEMRESLMKALS